ncbi:hypothetical protein KRR38_22375 [Novosphingobium sp. G106]|uniref:hypothetical protein n=1 Tax=Novosphingobium sp. G106 TaxID=2849500 RepID=UPI001C2DB11B|nr:hypothetical protein [Novosphingobium sp. G106]MBV1690354.1 hypothetical protein [Novosphingobium sp. G106]
MDETTLANMRLRIERCRRLARSCTDEKTVRALLEMAEDGEADIARMMAKDQSATSG